jgi:hypothetical protein
MFEIYQTPRSWLAAPIKTGEHMSDLIKRLLAVEIAGENLVKEAEDNQADATHDWDGETVTYKSHAYGYDSNGNYIRVTAVYYQNLEDYELAEELDHLDWVCAGYEVCEL